MEQGLRQAEPPEDPQVALEPPGVRPAERARTCAAVALRYDARMSTEEDQADLSVYDLAEKMAAGMQLSTAAQREVAAELLRLKAEYDRAMAKLGSQ